MVINKILSFIDYFFYSCIISPIPFAPGNYIRKIYFQYKMGAKIGRNVIINSKVSVGAYNLLELQDDVSIMSNVLLGYAIGGRIVLKKGALIGHDVTFVNNMHEFKDKNIPVQYQGYRLPHQNIIIGKNVWIGTRAVILPGVTVGDYSIIGAGAVVTKDIPANSIAAGVPAKVIRKR